MPDKQTIVAQMRRYARSRVDLEIDGNYAMQTAYYSGLSTQILTNNTGLINNQQFYGVPPHTANAGIGYSNKVTQFTARLDTHYVSQNNGLNRPAFRYSTANVSKTVGPLTFKLGVYNVFNQSSGQFGLIGLGTPACFNQYGSPNAIPYLN